MISACRSAMRGGTDIGGCSWRWAGKPYHNRRPSRATGGSGNPYLLNILLCSNEKSCGNVTTLGRPQVENLRPSREDLMEQKPSVSRRSLLSALGVPVGGTALAGASMVAGPQLVRAVEPAKGRIPDPPFKVGHMTFLTSAAAVLGEPSLKGHTMAAEEINAQGGLLGKRKIET